MAFSNWSRWLRSMFQPHGRTIRKRNPLPRRPFLETLEDRVVMSVLPAPEVTNPRTVGTGNAPQLAVDPTDPTKMVVFSSTTTGLSGRFSTNGGATWTNIPGAQAPSILREPTSATAPQAFFAQVTTPSVTFDRNGNFYLVSVQHDAANTSGAIVFEKYDFSGGTPVLQDLTPLGAGTHKVLYRWLNTDAAYNPIVAIDNNLDTYTDPATGLVQTDTMVGKAIYVAWNTNEARPAGSAITPISKVYVAASEDEGLNFTTPQRVSVDGTQSARPQIVFTQGTGYEPGVTTPRIEGGQLIFAFSSFFPITGQSFMRIDATQPDNGVLADPVAAALEVTGTGGNITDADHAVDGSNNPLPSIVRTTDFTINVTAGQLSSSFDVLRDLDATVSIQHPFLEHLQLILIAPNGTQVRLLRNRITNAGANTGQGVAGANMGWVNPTGNAALANNNVGTVFDSQAPRNIVDTSAATPWAAHFRPEADSMNDFVGMTAAQLVGTWTLRIIDNRNEAQMVGQNNTLNQFLRSWSLNFTSRINTTGFGTDDTVTFTNPLTGATVTQTTLPYSATNQYTTLVGGAGGAPGAGPAMSIAIDNTLGSYSPFQGRLYLGYNGGGGTNTNVFVMHSDDAGGDWEPPVQLNDDSATDYFSEGVRPQFMPTLAVDQTTGTLVATYYDGRYDPSLIRVATSIATSIDGGDTFSPISFLNTPKTATDMISGNTVFIEPIPSNQLAAVAGVLGFGDRQALYANGGRVVSIFSGNQNAAGAALLSATTTIAAGPRIVFGDMGVIDDDFVDPLNTVTYNNTFTSNGIRRFNGFVVAFDRPIDIASFTGDDVVVAYRNTVTTTTNPPNLIVTGDGEFTITPLDAGDDFGPGTDPTEESQLATTFLISLNTPLSGVGTYSYTVGPDINDNIRSTASVLGGGGGGTTFNAAGAQVGLTVPPTGTGGNVGLVFPTPPATNNDTTNSTITVGGVGIITDVNVRVQLSHTFAGDLSFRLVAPDGTAVILTQRNGGGAVNAYANTTFDDEAFVSVTAATPPYTFVQPENPLFAFDGLNADGVWTLQLNDSVGGDIGTLNGWSLTFNSTSTTVFNPGNLMDMDQDAVTNEANFDQFTIPTPVNGIPFQLPYTQDTLPLIIPGPHVVSTRTPNTYSVNVPEAIPDRVGAVNGQLISELPIPSALRLSDLSVRVDITHPRASDLRISLRAPDGTTVQLVNNVASAGANFTNTFFDDQATTSIATGAAPFSAVYRPAPGSLASFNGSVLLGIWELIVVDSAIGEIGTLNNWTLYPSTSDNLTLNNVNNSVEITFDRDMDPASFETDNILRVMGPLGPITTYRQTTPAAIPDRVGVVNGVLTSTLTVTDSLSVNNLGVLINLTHPRVGDLRARLIAPDGFAVQLFNTGLTGADLTNTIFDDFATTPISGGTAPYTGLFRPVGSLRAFNSKNYLGDWKLEITDTVSGQTGTLNSWALNPMSVTPLTSRTFRVSIPTQSLNGTYTFTIGPDAQGNYIKDTSGNSVDTNLNAGLDLLRGGDPINGVAVVNNFPSGTINTALPAGQTIDSKINVTNSFLVQGVTLQFSILHQNVPDLEATLISPSGTQVKLFTRVGNFGTTPHANFTNTVLDDSALLAIQQASTIPTIGVGAGPYTPQFPLSALKGESSVGEWTLRIESNSSVLNGTLVNWTLRLTNSVAGSGLGQPVADRIAADFRIFTQDPTNEAATDSWTAVGPAPINDGPAQPTGRIGGLAVDPSDPSGNTVFTAGASGGVWKTYNFLTTDPNGPTWQPLTDFGQANSLNTGSIAIFPRNNDPNQSIVFVLTGEGDTGTPGVGVLRSMDGGRTWRVLDSLVNADAAGNILPIQSPVRNRRFVGTTGFKVVVDPVARPNGEVIVYIALSGGNGGVYRSIDTGKTWTLMRAGNASDVVLSAGSAVPGGNLQILFAAFRGDGVYYTTSAPSATSLSVRPGAQGVQIRRDVDFTPDVAVPVSNPSSSPGGSTTDRILLATPVKTGNPLQDTLQQGWVYALCSTPAGVLQGVYVTKDFGLNWTRIRIPFKGPAGDPIATNDDAPLNPDISVIGTAASPQGNYNATLIVDPSDPAVIYIGGSPANGWDFIRVDTSTIADPYAMVGYDNSNNDGGLVQFSTTGAVTVKPANIPFNYGILDPLGFPRQPYFNMLRDPDNPFLTPASLPLTGVQRFNNDGTNNRYRPIDRPFTSDDGTDHHEVAAFVDPLTGYTRLIYGNDHGIFTQTLDPNGIEVVNVGASVLASGTRNGNLQITQMYEGAVQPSVLAADIAGALFYSVNQDTGFPTSSPDVLDTGAINWEAPGFGDGAGVATDQTGSGTAYYYKWPCCGGGPLSTDFFSVVLPVDNEISRTSGLIYPGDNPSNNAGQYPDLGGSRFAVNPIDPTGIVMSASGTSNSTDGRLFRTSGPTLGMGIQWFPIADPSDLDSTYAPALAFGAPADATTTALNDFIYAGTIGGKIFVTFTGGGVGAPWKDISAGLVNNAPIQYIVTNPTRGSREAYAVSSTHVYWMADSGSPTASWVPINGNLFSPALQRPLYNDPTELVSTLRNLTSLQADWRFAIPDDLSNPTGPTHPVLYVGGSAGVYRSLDKGVTWTYFPNVGIDNAVQEGGLLPAVGVTDLDLSLGDINPADGTPSQPQGRNMLVATTYGRGVFMIRLDDRILLPNGASLFEYAKARVAGPHIVDITPETNGNLEITGLRIEFSGVVDPVTFTTADIGYILDPTGATVNFKEVRDVTGGQPHNIYVIDFETAQSQYGFYYYSFGPQISDYAGNQMDQDQDLVNGEVTPAANGIPNNNTTDVFTGRVLFQPWQNHAPVLNTTTATVPDVTEDQTNTTYLLVGGSGYTANDVLTIQGGTFTTPAQVRVNTVNGAGGITSFTLLTRGVYSVDPVSPAGVTGGTGTGALFMLSVEGLSVASFVAALTPAPGITDADNTANGGPPPNPGYAPLTAPVGIAVTGVNNTNGTWQFSLNSGATWTNFGTPTDAVARLLEAVPNNRIRFLPNADYSGPSSFTFRAWDLTSGLTVNGSDGSTADASVNPAGAAGDTTAYSEVTATATINVLFVNDVPSFTVGPNRTVLEDSGAQSFANSATNISPDETVPPAPDEAGQLVDFIVTNNNNALFSVQPAIAPDGTLTFTPAPDANGVATVSVQIHDNGGTARGGVDTSFVQTFTITVTAVNDAPFFTIGPDRTVNEDAGAQSIPGGATGIAAGPPDEVAAGQVLTFQVTNSNNALFTAGGQPAISPTGVLTFTSAPNANGSATVTVRLMDNGGTANGGVNLSGPQTFTITVTAVNDPPSFTPGPNRTVLEDSGPFSAGWATAILPYPASPPPLATDENGQTVTFLVSNNNNALFSAQPAISPTGVLTFTPAADANGVATVTVQLMDNGGTANGGNDTSTTRTFTITVTAVNDAPFFTAGPNQTVLEDAGVQSVANWATGIAAGPPNESGQTLTFLVTNDNNTLFSTQPAIAANGTLTYTPAANANGSATVTVRLQDNGGTANSGVNISPPQTFTITVTPVNDPPSFSKGPDQTVLEDSGTRTVANWATAISAGPPNETGQTLTFLVSNNNTALFSTQPAIAANGTLTFTPAPDANGTATVTVQLMDNGGTANGGNDTSAAQTFLITVTPVNDVPSFVKGPDQTVLEDAPAQSVANWATGISAGPPNESSQVVDFIVTNNNNALFSTQPAISPTGTLTYTPAANANGVATVTVRIHDNGGTTNGGVDTSAAQTFTITITAVNDAPVFTKGPDVAVNEDSGAATVAPWATAVAAGPPDESGQVLTFLVSNDNNALFSTQPAVATNGTLSFTPAPNANGTATVTVRLMDNGGTADGGSDTSAPQTFVITVRSVNDPPSFTVGANQTVLEDAGAQSVSGFLTNILPYPASPPPLALDESGQTVSFLVTNSNNAAFSAQPAIAPNGTLTYTPALNAVGTITVTVRAQDSGGTANGGVDTSAPQTFTITLTPVNDPPSFVAGANQSVLEDAGAQTVSGWATGISPGPIDEAGQTVNFLVSNNNTTLFSTQPSVSPAGVLTYTPAANANGTATVTVRLMDNGGTANGGNDTSAPQTFTITVVAVNDVPSFTVGANQTVLEDAGAQVVPNFATNLSAGPPDENGQLLDFLVTTSNNALFASLPAIDASGTLSYTSALNAVGTVTVTVRIHDNGGTANGGVDTSDPQTFTITLTPVNDAPSFTRGLDQSVLEDAGTQTVANWATAISAGPPDESGQSVNFLVSNNNNALFSTQPSIAANGTLSYTPAPNANGTATVTVQLMDNGGTANGGANTSAAQTFTITVVAVNDVPSFVRGFDQTVLEDAGAQTVANWATSISPGPANESGQTVDFIVSNNNNSLFSVQPSVSPTGTLSYTPAANANGTATVSVQIRDNGGTANGGANTSAVQTFTINVTPVNDQPSFTATNPPTVVEDDGLVSVPGFITGFNPGPNEASQGVLSYLISNVSNSALFSVLPSVATNGTLSYTLAVGVPGSSTFDVRVRDNGGTANGGVDTSLAQTFTINVLPLTTTTTLTSSDDASVFGQPVTFTATVDSVNNNKIPTGVVSFQVNGVQIGTGNLDGNGQAAFTTANLLPGNYNVKAVYQPSGSFDPSESGVVAQNVVAAGTQTVLTSSANPSLVGVAVQFTVTVSSLSPGEAIPTGTVTFLVDGVVNATVSVNGAGQATLSLPSGLSAGPHTITAVYNPSNGNFTASTASIQQQSQQQTTTTLTSTPANPTFGETITFTARVRPTRGTAIPQGTVTFVIDGVVRDTVSLNATGRAVYQVSDLSVALHTVAVTYNGGGNFAGSQTSGTKQVLQAQSKVRLTGPLESALDANGQPTPQTFVAQALARSPATGVPTGMIQFFVDGAPRGTFQVDAFGQASITISDLGLGTHTIRADYLGSGDFSRSSRVLSHKVTRGGRRS